MRNQNSYFVIDLNSPNNLVVDIVENKDCKNIDDIFHLMNNENKKNKELQEKFTYNFDEYLVHLVDQALVEHNIDKEYVFVRDDIGSSWRSCSYLFD